MQELDLILLAGSTKLTNVIVKKHAKAMLSAGSLKVTNCTLNISAELAAGSASIEQLLGKNYMTLSAGSLTLIEKTDISYDVSENDELIVKSNAGSIKIKAGIFVYNFLYAILHFFSTDIYEYDWLHQRN